MPHRIRWFRVPPLAALAAALLLSLCLPATAAPLCSEEPIRLRPEAWRWLRLAGLVFHGTVLKVEAVPPKLAGSPALVAITFHVDDGIRGARAGQTLSINEWAGTWLAHPRYRVGQRALLVLYKPNAAGVTSEVADIGRLPVAADGTITIPPLWLVGAPPASPRPVQPLRVPAERLTRQLRSGLRRQGAQP